MNITTRKCMAIILVIAIMLTGTAGCTKGNKDTQNSAIAMGRYVEKEIVMPREADKEVFFQLEADDKGCPTLFACSKDTNQKGVYQYTLQQNGEWEKSSVDWLNNISVSIPYMSYLIFGTKGEQYFYTAEDKDGHLYPCLIKAVDQATGKEVCLEGWDDKEGTNMVPSKINILKNGNIICAYQDNIVTYDKDTYKSISTDRIDSGVLSSFTTMGDEFALFKGGNTNEPEGVIVCDDKFNKIEEVPFEVPNVEGSYNMYVTDNKSIIMCNVNGIHLLSHKTKLWETIVEGSLTSLSLPSLYNIDIIQTPAKDYFILYGENSSDNYKLMKYSYDPNTQTTPSVELSIYSLKTNPIILEAANVFQRKHPEVKVTLRASMEEDNLAQKADYIKALNTELLSGNGSDLIVLDDLPKDAYIAKGALEDISNVIQPMLDSGELLPNIIENYGINQKYYSVPTRFTIPIVYGNTKVVNESSSLDNIVNYVKSNPDTALFGQLSYSDLVAQFLPMHMGKLYDDKGVIKKQALVEFLGKLKIISDATGCVADYGEDQGKPSYYDLASSSDISLENTKSLYDFCLPNSILKYINGSFISYENSFNPMGEIGINSSSKNKELSLEFIQTLLSAEVQNQAFWDGGFPVNSSSLEKGSNTADASYRAETEIENESGTYSPLIIQWPSADRVKKITDLCRMVSYKTMNNDTLFNMILAETDQFFEGSTTAESTADAIIKKANLYLSE